MKHIIVIAVFAIILFSGCTNQGQETIRQPNSTLANQQSQETTQSSQETAQLRQVELNIEGLWCESCVYGIQSVMNTTPGIESAEVKITDYAAQTGTATVAYNSSQITKSQIANLTNPYPSKIVRDVLIN